MTETFFTVQRYQQCVLGMGNMIKVMIAGNLQRGAERPVCRSYTTLFKVTVKVLPAPNSLFTVI